MYSESFARAAVAAALRWSSAPGIAALAAVISTATPDRPIGASALSRRSDTTVARPATGTTSADSAAAAAYVDTLAWPLSDAVRRLRTTASLAFPADTDPRDTTRRDTSHTHHMAGRDAAPLHAAMLGAVTVAATRINKTEPVSVVTVTPAAIANAAANSPWELLRQTAGVEAHEQGQGPGFASDLSIRGFSSDHSTDIALWIDGVPINEPINGHAEGYNDFSLMFPQAVSDIDLIKGPTSALYGNFAFSGVVNVRTLEHWNGTRLDLSGGNYGHFEGVLLTGFDHDATRGVLGIRATHDDGWRPHAGNQMGQLHARYLHDLSGATTVDLGVEGYLTSYKSPGFLDTASYLAGRYSVISNLGDGGFKRHAQERGSVRIILSPNVQWRSTIYATQGTWNFWLSTPPGLGGLHEGSGVETHEYDGRYGAGATSALTYSSPAWHLTLGGETRYDHSHYENWAEAASGFRQDSAAFALLRAHQTSGGLFAQSAFDVTRYVRIDVGGRLDQLGSVTESPDSLGRLVSSQHSKGMFSPKTGLLARVLPWADLYVNASRGFRQADGVISNPRVPFITVWDYEAGVKVERGPITANATVFRMDLSNEQAFNGVTTLSGGPSRRRGVDVSGSLAMGRAVTLSTSFTVLDAKYTRFIDRNPNPRTGMLTDYSGRPVFNTSRFVGDAALEMRPPASIWHLRLGTNFQGKYTPFEEAVGLTRPAFALLHASGGVRLGRGNAPELDVGLRNILDTRYRELESGYFVAPGQPRTVYARVQWVP